MEQIKTRIPSAANRYALECELSEARAEASRAVMWADHYPRSAEASRVAGRALAQVRHVEAALAVAEAHEAFFVPFSRAPRTPTPQERSRWRMRTRRLRDFTAQAR